MSENNNIKLIYTLVEHRIFGFIVIPYIVTNKNNSTFYSVVEQLLKDSISSWKEIVTPIDEEILDKVDEYSERSIFKIFSKNKNSKEFYSTINAEFVNDRIRPFIEKRLYKIVRLIGENNLFLFYKDKKYNTIHSEDEIVVINNPANPVFNFNKSISETLYRLTINVGDNELELIDKSWIVISKDPCAIIIDNILYFINDLDSNKLLPFFTKKNIIIPKSSEKKYFETFVYNSIKKFEVKPEGFSIKEVVPGPMAILSVGENLSTEPVLFLHFSYSHHKVLHINKTMLFVDFKDTDDTYEYVKYSREMDWEKKIINTLLRLGLKEEGNYFVLSGELQEGEAELYGYVNWINKYQDELIEVGIKLENNFKNVKYYKGSIDLDVDIIDKNDWFDVHAIVRFGDSAIPFAKLRKYILKGIREYELPNGEIAILPKEWFATYKEIVQFGNFDDQKFRLKKHHFKLVNESFKGINQKYFKELEKINKFEKIKGLKLPGNINATLREYQIQGYKWMINLQKNNFGGCLADDMGLGKTLQTLSVLQNSKEHITNKIEDKIQRIKHGSELMLFDDSMFDEQSTLLSPVSLIIMPSSLLHNWENEILKFTPDLRICKFTGSGRTKQQIDFQYFDIVLTTYGVARNDIDLLQNFYFHYIILDESQVVKNPASKIYKSILKLQSKYKLVLTGTPIENSLIDLWSQLNFLNRGILGNLSFFKSEFVTPIEKNGDEVRQEKLQSIINPFILRRNKIEVAKDLPPVSEQVIYCDMPKEHNSYYEKEKSKIRNLVLNNIEKDGLKKSSVIILQGLTKLRQIANHPVLIDKTYEGESGKYEEVIRNLENIVAEEHKLLVFSSYIKHLELIKNYLDTKSIKYSILTGQTSNRKKVIDEFQNNNSNQVFLITLKAGGVGLNLTAADYVFVLDPWWNPASEEQAISRAHRIGQDKNVFVYRFISTETIEEKIQNLKAKKSNLANLFVNTNNPFKGIEEEHIKELFS